MVTGGGGRAFSSPCLGTWIDFVKLIREKVGLVVLCRNEAALVTQSALLTRAGDPRGQKNQ